MALDGSGLTAVVEDQNLAVTRNNLSKLDVPVQVAAQQPMKLRTRCDSDPLWLGGVSINNDTQGRPGMICTGPSSSSYHCSGGFGVRIDSARYLLTAGHCGAPGDHFSGDTRRYIGQVTDENVGHDLMLIKTESAGWIWDGTPGESDFIKPVIGWGWTYKGQSLCYSGATSGARRGHKVGGAFTTICGDEIYGHRECYNDMISAKVPGGMLGGLGGDSGPRSSNSPTTTRRYAPWARSRAAPSG
jgi:hypothetical protein